MAVSNTDWYVIGGRDVFFNAGLSVGVKITHEQVRFFWREGMFLGQEVEDFFCAVGVGANVDTSYVYRASQGWRCEGPSGHLVREPPRRVSNNSLFDRQVGGDTRQEGYTPSVLVAMVASHLGASDRFYTPSTSRYLLGIQRGL